MKIENLRKITTFMLFAVSGILGAVVAYMVIRTYETIALGILGLAILFLMHRVFLLPNKNPDDDAYNSAYEFPKDMKYLAITFFSSFVFYSAIVQIIRMVWFILL